MAEKADARVQRAGYSRGAQQAWPKGCPLASIDTLRTRTASARAHTGHVPGTAPARTSGDELLQRLPLRREKKNPSALLERRRRSSPRGGRRRTRHGAHGTSSSSKKKGVAAGPTSPPHVAGTFMGKSG